MQDTDHNFMRMALDLAARGRGYTSPNPMVGAVIVKDDWVVGQGWHEAAGLPHAEANAIADAGEHARGATLYVTLEPCNHQGRTPPCTQAIVSAGIQRVVVAMTDPNPHVAGGGITYLRASGIEVTTGICEAEAWRLNAFFIKHIQNGRPYVILKCAATLDGRIATKTGDSKWVTGEAARTHVHETRHAVDAIMVGVDTVKSDNPSLTTRLPDQKGVDPVRIILDTRLSIPEDAKVLQPGSDSDTLVITGNSGDASIDTIDPDKRRRLEEKGVHVLSSPVAENDRIDLPALMDMLGQRGIMSLLVEGGSRVAASVLTARLVDRIQFFYAPKILAGDGIAMCSGPGPEKMASAIGVENTEIRYLGDDLLIEGDIVSEDTGPDRSTLSR